MENGTIGDIYKYYSIEIKMSVLAEFPSSGSSSLKVIKWVSKVLIVKNYRYRGRFNFYVFKSLFKNYSLYVYAVERPKVDAKVVFI